MLIFEEKLPSQNRSAIVNKINSVSSNLGISPNWLMAVMNFESGLNPKAKNPYSGATGLIQFMPSTAAGLGTSTEQLFFMPFEKQLDYVEKYYRPWKSKIKGFVDLYLTTFFPAALGKPSSFVIQTANIPPSLIASQNPIFDLNKDNKVTISEIKKVILAKVPKDYLQYVTGTSVGIGLGFLGLATLVFIMFKTLK